MCQKSWFWPVASTEQDQLCFGAILPMILMGHGQDYGLQILVLTCAT